MHRLESVANIYRHKLPATDRKTRRLGFLFAGNRPVACVYTPLPCDRSSFRKKFPLSPPSFFVFLFFLFWIPHRWCFCFDFFFFPLCCWYFLFPYFRPYTLQLCWVYVMALFLFLFLCCGDGKKRGSCCFNRRRRILFPPHVITRSLLKRLSHSGSAWESFSFLNWSR